jgi:hypothetical protein
MALTEYRFLDVGGALEYRVACRACGSVYCEANIAAAA